MNSKWEEIQQAEEHERAMTLLRALQKIDRAGLRDEALLCAFEGGVLSQFNKLIQEKDDA